MGDYGHKKRESSIYNTLNMLVYDYLVKTKYEGTAKVFLNEAGLGDFKPTEGAPILAQWYAAFHDISAVRSGMSSSVHDLSRIEGIMMRLENERRRHQHIGRVDPTIYGGMREMDSYKYPMYYPHHFEQRKMYEMYGQMSPVEPVPRFYDPRKSVSDYRSMQGHLRYPPRFDEQPPVQNMKPPMRQRDGRYVNVNINSPMMPKAEPSPSLDPVLSAGDKPFGLKEIMGFVPCEHPLVCSATAREHKILMIASSNKTVTAVNLLSGKNEAVVETNGNQVIDIKMQEHEEYIVVVCNVGSNELLLMRYAVKGDVRFEIVGMLRGHMAPIVSYEVLGFIYSLDGNGIMRRWSLHGVFEREEVLSGNVIHICCISEDNFMLADKQRVYVYDFELNIEMMEILRGHALEIKRIDKGFIVIFRNQAVWFDKRVHKVKSLSTNNETIKTATLIDSDIVVASSHDAWFSTGKALNRMKLHEASVISLDSVNMFRKSSIVSCAVNGECKIWSKYLND